MPESPDGSEVVSQALMRHFGKRQDAENDRRSVEALHTTLDRIQKQQRAETARTLLEVTKVLDRLNLLVSNLEQQTLPTEAYVEKDCLTYLEMLNQLYGYCAPAASDTPETTAVKRGRTTKIFDLVVRTLNALLTYTRSSEVRSKEKLAKLLSLPTISQLVPAEFVPRLADELFSAEQKTIAFGGRN